MRRTLFPIILVLGFSSLALASTSDASGFYNNEEGSPLIALIDSARKSIDIEIYEMEDTNVLNAIRRALDRNVKVQIVQEPAPLGDACKIFNDARAADDADCIDRKKLVMEVSNRNGLYVPFSKSLCGVADRSCFQHGKIMIVDKSTVLISTGNFNDTNLCDLSLEPTQCDRDYSFVTSDNDVVSTLNTIFQKDIKGDPYSVSGTMGPKAASKLTVSPISLPSIIDFIGSATTSIQIENQYLHEPQINAALVKAANRGIKVDVMVSSFCNFAQPSASVREKTAAVFSAFDKAGISSRLFTKMVQVKGKPGYLHAKAIVVDGSKAWIGSMNGSTESATMNREFGIYFDDPEGVKQLSDTMQNDEQNPGTESWQESLNCQKER